MYVWPVSSSQNRQCSSKAGAVYKVPWGARRRASSSEHGIHIYPIYLRISLGHRWHKTLPPLCSVSYRGLWCYLFTYKRLENKTITQENYIVGCGRQNFSRQGWWKEHRCPLKFHPPHWGLALSNQPSTNPSHFVQACAACPSHLIGRSSKGETEEGEEEERRETKWRRGGGIFCLFFFFPSSHCSSRQFHFHSRVQDMAGG